MHFDASGIIYAWDEYPIKNFPKFWEWIETGVRDGTFRILQDALDEVSHKYPECADWLKKRRILRVPLTDKILTEAERTKTLLGIEEEAYGSGVDEIDLLVIAAAKIESETVLTQEARQTNLPREKKNYKIPAVCNMEDVGVIYHNVREWIINSGKVFG